MLRFIRKIPGISINCNSNFNRSFTSATAIIKKMTKFDNLKPIVWIDCEMTGLDHTKDHIIEICCLITDKNLNLLDNKGYESVIHYPKETMDQMNQWCIDHHGSSGLTEKVIKSDKSLETVENQLLTYIESFVSKGVGILAGNSVHMDRIFMLREMPKITDYLTYRIIDVSSIMEFSKRHNNKLNMLMPKKKGCHTAREDILESIQQMKYYRDFYFKGPDEIDGKKIFNEINNKDIKPDLDIDLDESGKIIKKRKV